MTGGRLKRVAPYLKDEEAFCFTYGDGVADINIKALLAFHKSHGKDGNIVQLLFLQEDLELLDISEGQVKSFKKNQEAMGL